MNSEQRKGKLTASFLGLPSQPPAEVKTTAGVQDIQIVPSFNPRSLLGDEAFTDAALDGLVASIQKHGVLQPLLVRRQADTLFLIAGERRLHAARLAGLKEVPIRVFDIEISAARVLAIIENAQREEVDVVSETLLGFQLLQEHTGLSESDLLTHLQALRKGRTEDVHGLEQLLRSTYGTGVSLWSQRRAAVLRMTNEEREAIRRRDTEVAVCAELVKIKDHGERLKWLHRAISEQLSAPQLRQLLASAVAPAVSVTLKARVIALRRALGKIESLEGQKAHQAHVLLERLERLLND
ncbi:ParB/RepB/Spo0J family partition protein (plasmid) [Deinococcus radiomollis]|uniref:ParB/RepB/Spo0J family partition protein n=1 Tax=Deinococcus radiomollis TaxID=468916 RepID=UPI003892418C